MSLRFLAPLCLATFGEDAWISLGGRSDEARFEWGGS
jgi:hypothetical protein